MREAFTSLVAIFDLGGAGDGLIARVSQSRVIYV